MDFMSCTATASCSAYKKGRKLNVNYLIKGLVRSTYYSIEEKKVSNFLPSSTFSNEYFDMIVFSRALLFHRSKDFF